VRETSWDKRGISVVPQRNLRKFHPNKADSTARNTLLLDA